VCQSKAVIAFSRRICAIFFRVEEKTLAHYNLFGKTLHPVFNPASLLDVQLEKEIVWRMEIGWQVRLLCPWERHETGLSATFEWLDW